VFKTAEPDETGAMPSDVGPSKNSTLPEAEPAPGAFTLTVAVIATLCPNVDGFGTVATLVVVLAWFTVWLCAAEVLPLKLGSPE
jgi:hypothetical protein